MRRSWIASLVGALVIGTALATPAAAHDALVASDPPDGAVLDAAPGAIVLEFTGNVLDVNPALQVTDPAGEIVEVGEAQIDGTVVTWDVLGELAGGQHDVVWVVTSSDGHPIDGELSFTAPQSESPQPEPSQTPESTATASPVTEEDGDVSQSDDTTPTPTAEADEPVPADLSDNAEAWFFGGLAVTALVVVAVVLVMRRNRDPNGPPGQH